MKFVHTNSFRRRPGGLILRTLGITLSGVLALGTSCARGDFEIASVHLANGGATVVLQFTSLPGMRHRLETAFSLESGTWTDTGVSVEGDGVVKSLELSTTGLGGRQFLRVTAATAVSTASMLIPAGTFQMGDSFNDFGSNEGPVHEVNVGAFFLQAKETTKAEWEEVHTWALANGYTFDNTGSGKAPDHPVHTVSWYDVTKWCNAKSQKEGLVPCYYTDTAQTTVYKTQRTDVANAMVKWDASGYRLPTEAEWEKAGRGGLPGRRFPWGDAISHTQANFWNTGRESYQTGTSGSHPSYDDGNVPYTSPVGSFAPNAYGLYDMTGNVSEWCWDGAGRAYSTSSETNPHGPDSGSGRVYRGGSWSDGAIFSRVAFRSGYYSDTRGYFVGFRVARRP